MNTAESTRCVRRSPGQRTWSSGRWRCAHCPSILCTAFKTGWFRHLHWCQKHLTQHSWRAWGTAGSPLGDEKRGQPHCRSTLQLPSGCNFRDWTIFPGALPPLLFFSSTFMGEGVALTKELSSPKSSNKLDAPEGCIRYSVCVLPAQNGGCASCSLRGMS